MTAPAPTAPTAGWRGPLIPINTESGDGRIYELADGQDVDVRPLPLPLCAQDEIAEGHDGGKVVGRIDRVWVEDGAVWGEGTFDLADPNAAEWARRLSEGYAGWVSADMDRTQFSVVARDVDGVEIAPEALATGDVEEGNPLIRVSSWRIMGATMVSGPAFAEAKIVAADVPVEPVTAALTAAGIVYQANDFADPLLSGPTALTVSEDGRVTGHLCLWDSCHIGYKDSCVTPPRSASDYRYFHQGLVSTDQGDLPVGKLTLGTGHAGMGDSAAQAASHYDHSGSAVCVVRAGEDEHGVWLSGRVLPGTGDARVDEMRRCGVSGDWRSINGQLELVAALCVNVPGFPIPRTEALAASGQLSLVAAGVVANRAGGGTRKACGESQATRRAEADRLAVRLRGPELAGLDARMRTARLAVLDARMASVRTPPRATRLVVTADGNPTNDRKAKPLERYWTEGPGLARWADMPHPYTALVDALTEEAGSEMTPGQIKGLAANYFRKVKGIWPGERFGDDPVGPGAVTADAYLDDSHDTDGMIALLPTPDDAARLAVGDVPADELHLTLAYLPDVGDYADPQALAALVPSGGPISGEVNGTATLGDGSAAVWLVNAPGLTDTRAAVVDALGAASETPDVSTDFDGYLPHITYGSGGVTPGDPAGAGPVTFDRVRVALRGEYTDIPLAQLPGDSPEMVLASALSTRQRSRRRMVA